MNEKQENRMKISPNQDINILDEIKKNTYEILKEVKTTTDLTVENIQNELTEFERKEERRKEQLKEAQKKFTKLSISVKFNFKEKFEKLALSQDMTTTQYLRFFTEQLVYNQEFQEFFNSKLENKND